jgi:hypothetical protein
MVNSNTPISEYYGFDARRYIIVQFLMASEDSIDMKVKLIKRPKQACRDFHDGFYRSFMSLFMATKDVFSDQRKEDQRLNSLIRRIEQWDREIERRCDSPLHREKKVTPVLVRQGITYFQKYVPYLKDKNLVNLV